MWETPSLVWDLPETTGNSRKTWQCLPRSPAFGVSGHRDTCWLPMASIPRCLVGLGDPQEIPQGQDPTGIGPPRDQILQGPGPAGVSPRSPS